MSSELIIRHCAPTLAGIKIGNVFSCDYTKEETLKQQIMEQNRLLNGKGLFFYLLRCANGKALIYVYRLRKLICHLQQKQVQAFLQEQGYDQLTVAPCLRRLREHLQKNEFPHEIGVFLGYPLGDIRGFMEHRGANCKCTGHWKVYTDIASAQRTFDRYQRCTNCYLQRYLQGFDITQLTLVG